MPSKVVSAGGKPRPPNAGKGRIKGVPNKTTQDVRATVALIAGQNIGRVQEWLDRIALGDPDRALDLYLRMLEYHIPKLARAEVTGAGGGPVVLQVSSTDERL